MEKQRFGEYQREIILSDPKTFPPQLSTLFGPQQQIPDMQRELLKINQKSKPLSLNVKTITLSPRRAWEVKLNNDMILYIGRDFMDERLERFIRLYPFVRDHKQEPISYIDSKIYEWVGSWNTK